MADSRRSGKLAVILHADVAGSTELVQRDERLAHERIQQTFHRFGDIISQYHGRVRELRGDALLAEFERASDAVTAALAFQADQTQYNTQLKDPIQPTVRVGIAMGEVIIADNTVTGAGVVLAQRVEQLANPGEVVIQGAAYETIPGRFPFEYADRGEHTVKGFDKPVRAYSASLKSDTTMPQPEPKAESESEPEQADHQLRNTSIAIVSVAVITVGIALTWFRPWEVREEPASLERMAFPLPDKPSIAVLPFNNMSNDEEQEYFVDGVTEDLITDLSKLSGLFVIARNSVFSYKGKPVKVSQVAEELGVRYVLEGSVRRSGDQVRINAQLIDATTGGHLWAERYDGTLTDVFSLQDQVTEKIVAALAVSLPGAIEHSSIRGRETDVPESYDLFLKGWQHYRRDTPEHYAQALGYFRQAVELDPDYARAWAAIATVYWRSFREEWYAAIADQIPGEAEGLTTRALGYHAAELAEEILAKLSDKPLPLSLQTASKVALWRGRRPEALETAEKAISIDPNDADSYVTLAEVLIFDGQAERALRSIEDARRRDPHNEARYAYLQGLAEFGLDQFDVAATSIERSLELNPDLWSAQTDLGAAFCDPCLVLIAIYGYLGQTSEAETLTGKIKQSYPNFGISRTNYTWFYKNEADLDRLQEGLRKAGVPE